MAPNCMLLSVKELSCTPVMASALRSVVISLLSPSLDKKLISYGRLVDHGCLLGRSNGRHTVLKNKSVIFYVTMKNHVMVVDKSMNALYNCDFGDVMMSAVATVESGQALQKHTLMYFHRRFGHLNFDTNKRLASTPH